MGAQDSGTAGKRVLSGVVLGGGGARGFAHLGVLQVLEREGYPIDLIAGTSMGGLIGGLYALLGSSQAVIELQQRPADNKATRWSRAARPEFYESRRFRRWLGELFGTRTFADLHWPLGVTVVDIDTGAEIWINRGPVTPAIWATTAIPGVYAPVQINGRRMADGGVLDPVPVDLARRMGATLTLAIDVLPDPNRRAASLPAGYSRAMVAKFGVTMDYISKAFDIVLAAQRDYRLRDCPPDLLITPALHGLSAGDYTRGAEIIARGVEAAEAVLPQIRALRDRLLAGKAQGTNGHQDAAIPQWEQRT